MSMPMMTVSPAGVAQTYAGVAAGTASTTGPAAGPGGAGGFGSVLQRALADVVEAGHTADAQAMQAVAGGGNLTEVVTAVSRAELALQSAVAIRDKVVQAYQDVMRMPI